MVEQILPRPNYSYNGVFFLIVINLIMYSLDHFLKMDLRFLYLSHTNPHWYQFVTSTFCHLNWAHISGNLFFLYIFGKLIEEEEGTSGVILSYLICGIGANVASIQFQEANIVSLGASGAVFGLFSVSVLLKLSWHWRNLLEILILGQFVIGRVLSETQQLATNDHVNRIAHLGGAFVGVLLILLLMITVGRDNKKE